MMIYPSLNLDARLYLNDSNGKPSIASFTRASAAWCLDATGKLVSALSGVLRHDFAIDGSYLGWLIEESRTCHLIYNRDLTNAAWVKTNIAAAKDQAGIDAVTSSCSKITASAGNGTVLQSITDASKARALSAYVKRLVGTGTLEMTMDNGSTWTNVTAQVTGVGPNGFSRVTIPSQTLANPIVGFRIGTNGDSFAVDFVQIENGTFPTSPIETVASQVTRAADVLALPTSAFAFNAAQGTVVIRFTAASGLSANECALQLSDAAGSNYIALFDKSGSGDLRGLVSGGAADLFFPAGTALPSTSHCLALAYRANDFGLCADGSALLTDASGSVPAGMDTVRIGSQISFGNWLNGWVRHVAYFPRRLVNAELQDITR